LDDLPAEEAQQQKRIAASAR